MSQESKDISTVADFVTFGEGAIGPHVDDGSTGSIDLSVPVVYFGRQHDSFFVSWTIII